MGCYSLKEMISRALGKYNGKKKRNASHRMLYTPPPPAYSHRTTVAKSVNFSNHNPIFVIPSEPASEPEPGPSVPKHYSEPVAQPSPHGPSSSKGHEVTEPKRPKRSKKTRFAPEPDMKANTHPGPGQYEPGPDYHGSIRHEADPGYHGAVHRESNPSYQDPIHLEPGPVYRGPVPYYAPSPLPTWEYGARRQEYFSGEYCYYPTPIREGIYNIATDPHRLTTIFSEENPNACSIV